MNLMKIVNYRSAKAFYIVEYHTDKTFVATLEKYLGDNNHMPPKKVTFIKNNVSPKVGAPNASPSLIEDVNKALSKK